MSGIKSIRQQTNNRFLNCFELEAVHRDGRVSPYYVASPGQGCGVSEGRHPQKQSGRGNSLWKFTGSREIGWCSSASIATRLGTIYMNSPQGWWRTERE